jgi:hypothetical protein
MLNLPNLDDSIKYQINNVDYLLYLLFLLERPVFILHFGIILELFCIIVG